MKAYCITLKDNEYSKNAAVRCIASAVMVGVDVQAFHATPAERAEKVMEYYGLKWTWANGNTENAICPFTGLKQHPYKTHDFRMRVGCAMSHYRLWRECASMGETILILEHDTVFLRPLPRIEECYGAIMLNDPAGATPRGEWWAQKIANKGTGIHGKTTVFPEHEMRPDGLAGGSAYIITPLAAMACIQAYQQLGVWPNDATLCRQLVGGLQECYPFVTRVQPDKSMAGGY